MGGEKEGEDRRKKAFRFVSAAMMLHLTLCFKPVAERGAHRKRYGAFERLIRRMHRRSSPCSTRNAALPAVFIPINPGKSLTIPAPPRKARGNTGFRVI